MRQWPCNYRNSLVYRNSPLDAHIIATRWIAHLLVRHRDTVYHQTHQPHPSSESSNSPATSREIPSPSPGDEASEDESSDSSRPCFTTGSFLVGTKDKAQDQLTDNDHLGASASIEAMINGLLRCILADVVPACSMPWPVVVVEPDGLHFLQMSVTQSHHCVVVVWARWSMLV
jgi:hypothetical protein